MITQDEHDLITYYALDPAGQAEWNQLSDDYKAPYRVTVELLRIQAKRREAQRRIESKVHIQRTIRVVCGGNAVEYSFGTGDKEIIERNLGGDLKRLSTEQLHAFFEATVAAQREVRGGVE